MLHYFHKDKIGYFSLQVIKQLLKSLKDVLHPYENALEFSQCMLIDVLKLHLKNVKSASQDKFCFCKIFYFKFIF